MKCVYPNVQLSCFYIFNRLLLVTGIIIILGFPSGLDSKASVCNAGDLGSIPGLGRSPGEGNGNPLQYSRLENFMDRGHIKLITSAYPKIP